MLEEGAPTKVVSVQLGHTFTRITEDTYSHVTARLQKEAGDAIERVLGM
jgi:integrase